MPFAFLLSAMILCSQAMAATPLTTVRVASGFTKPLHVQAPAGDYDRLFVVEQGGKIRIVKDGVIQGTDFINLSAKVSASGNERGLLGLAFHPDYWNTGYFYVNYTRKVGHATVVERYKVSGGNPDVADPASNLIILGPISQPFSNHNGGNIQFSPIDGKLYVGMGDGGSGGDPSCFSQKTDTLLGKLLRINDDGTIPMDNPYVNDGRVLDEIWALGLRNPWRFSFDRDTGDLYIGDVGQTTWEEIDYQPASSTGKENYGWKVMEGFAAFNSTACPTGTPPVNDPSLTLPIHVYDHSANKCSITGGYMYRGCAVPDLQGTYFFADYCTAQIWSFRYDGIMMTDFQERTNELAPGGGLSIDTINSFGEDADGEIYIVDQGGEIFKIVADAPAPYVDEGFGKAGTGGLVPELDICGLMGTGDTAQLRLRKAKPSVASAIFVSFTLNPIPLLDGMLAPGLPATLIQFVNTGPVGELSLPFAGGGGPFDVYIQFLIADPGATQGVSFSNAIKAVFQP